MRSFSPFLLPSRLFPSLPPSRARLTHSIIRTHMLSDCWTYTKLKSPEGTGAHLNFKQTVSSDNTVAVRFNGRSHARAHMDVQGQKEKQESACEDPYVPHEGRTDRAPRPSRNSVSNKSRKACDFMETFLVLLGPTSVSLAFLAEEPNSRTERET
mmetsp:Transcript_50270/g.98990  ORF Transcript_50270/g.98990 Transcript_50270/m.98990 type:complete len:155 (+) Transcript_50270:360-824(+)